MVNLHSPRWSLTTKGSVTASPTRSWGGCCATLAANRNFLLRIQLELSVNSISPTKQTPSLIVTATSPVSNGLFPLLSLTIFLEKSSLLHASLLGKSPSTTTTSTLIAQGREHGTFSWSTSMIWRGFPSASVTLVPVKMGRERRFANARRRDVVVDGGWISLREGHRSIVLMLRRRSPFSTSSLTYIMFIRLCMSHATMIHIILCPSPFCTSTSAHKLRKKDFLMFC